MTEHAPIFILAAPFSGASFLAGVLGQHPQLYTVPELNLFMADTVGELLEIFEIGQGTHGQGLLRAIAELECGGQTDEGIDAARAWLQARAPWHSSELLQSLQQRVAPRRLVVPDTETPLRLADLLRLRAAAPDAAIVQLLRHPYSAGIVHAAWLGERLFVPIDFKDHSCHPPAIDPQLAWFRAHRNLDRQFGDGTLRVRIEDLDADPVAALRRICAALAIDDGAAALEAIQRPEEWPFAGFGPRAAPYGLEPDVLEDIGLPPEWDPHARLHGALPWRADGAGFSADLIELARQRGYG